jgi:hypothetical protein
MHVDFWRLGNGAAAHRDDLHFQTKKRLGDTVVQLTGNPAALGRLSASPHLVDEVVAMHKTRLVWLASRCANGAR